MLNPENPAEMGSYPATLPVELALRVDTTENICLAYGISQAQWNVLRSDPVFQIDLARAVSMVKKDGMSFKLKAQMQAEELLKTSWKMIHDVEDTPPSVRADLLKFTVRAAGYAEPAEKAGNAGNTLQIQINLN